MATIQIAQKKIILAEGIDAYYFLIHALTAYKIKGVQVFDFGGISQLTSYLLILSAMDNFDLVQTVVIARDAEANPDAAIDSIKHSLRTAKLEIPPSPFVFTDSNPKVAYMLFPGYNEIGDGSLSAGALEHLCLLSTNAKPILKKADDYLHGISTEHHTLTHPHKSRLHAYLSAHNNYAGLKIGEAAKAGAWDWDSISLAPFKKLLIEA